MKKKQVKKEKEFRKLLEKSEKYINYFSNLYTITGMERQDVQQVLRLKLFLRKDKYNPKYSFNTFIGSVFKREIYRLMKVSQRSRRIEEEATNYYLATDGGVSNFQYDGFDIMVDNVVHNIMSGTADLAERSVYVFKLFLQGKKSREVAWLLQKSNAKINQIKNQEIVPAVERTLGTPIACCLR
jgi:RNA polymerase sigma factor (sigma-70 family)